MRSRSLLVPLTIWLAVTFFFTASVMARYIGAGKSYTYMLYANAVHYGLWTILFPVIARTSRRCALSQGGRQHPALRQRALGLLAFALVLTPVVSLTNLSLLYHTYYPYKQWIPTFTALLHSDLWNSLRDDFQTCIVLLVAAQGWRVWRDLQTEQQRASELERQLAVSRLDALRMQLHPHFLFNTFHTITALIGEDPATARRMMVELGDLLRRTLEEPSAPLQSLARELELIDLYMGIQRLRLGDRVSLDYRIAPDAMSAEIPHLLLQPLFENAVRHGAGRLAGRCSILFEAARSGDRLKLRLENDAPLSGTPGREPGMPPRQGVGLSNTLGRLRLHYSDGFTFEYCESAQGSVIVDISLPYRQAAPEVRDVASVAHASAAD